MPARHTWVKVIVSVTGILLYGSFSCGDWFQCRVSRGSETVSFGFDADYLTAEEQTKIIAGYMGSLQGDDVARMGTLSQVLLRCKTGEEVLEKMTKI